MKYDEAARRLRAYDDEIRGIREKMREIHAQTEPAEVRDYELRGSDGGTVKLSELFGDKDDLFVIHNMGRSCPYCTLWADGLNGVVQHLESRAAFVVSSPDAPEVQRAFAAGRGWRFRMVSHQGSSFAEDLGYRDDDAWSPGVSAFRRTDGRIVRVADTQFGPGDDFCAVWHLLDLLPAGASGWEPRFKY